MLSVVIFAERMYMFFLFQALNQIGTSAAFGNEHAFDKDQGTSLFKFAFLLSPRSWRSLQV